MTLSHKELQDKITSMPLMLLFWGMGFWAISTIIRAWGWESVTTGHAGQTTTEEQPSLFSGIIVPFLFGVASLLFAVNWTGGD